MDSTTQQVRRIHPSADLACAAPSTLLLLSLVLHSPSLAMVQSTKASGLILTLDQRHALRSTTDRIYKLDEPEPDVFQAI